MCAAQWLPETRKELSCSLDRNTEGRANLAKNDLVTEWASAMVPPTPFFGRVGNQYVHDAACIHQGQAHMLECAVYSIGPLFAE